ncbi:MAG: KpsF/GutQ family sugar-phosphate isomerase [Leptospiraceae bacterium]|nr:KpsF/GutQ family sugar-phosphate isomerase [Leptospiraceae bacterium]
MNQTQEKILKAVDVEIESLNKFRDSLDIRFAEAVELIAESQGKLILTGVGKSGDIAKKIASTMTSTGTRAIFLHPTDAMHGDAGIITSQDIVLAIGKSGESDELISLLPTIKAIGAKLISMTANAESRLAKESDILLLTPVWKEACPLHLAPTSSTTIALVAGDAMAMALMEIKNFKEDNFALYHPAGRLGKRLSLSIDDVMRHGNELPKVFPEDELNKVLEEITAKLVGATGVVDENEKLIGIITDFDLRKKLTKGGLTSSTKAKDIMNPDPVYFFSGRKAYDVLIEMEERKRPISVAPVISSENRFLGMISLHDLLQRGLK